MKLLIVAVNYNTYQKLNAFIQSVNDSLVNCKNNVSVDIFVADNSSEKKSVNFDGFTNLSIKVVPLNNLGYLGGAQYILNQIQDKTHYDYIAISNVDLTLNHDFLDVLANYDCPKDIGWVAPSIYSIQENRNKVSLFRPSKMEFWLLCLLFKYPILFKFYRQTLYLRKRRSSKIREAREVYSGHGSFILLTNIFFKYNPVLSFKPFLFCEENYFAELLRISSLKCIYIPELKIRDEEHVSIGKIDYKKKCKFNYEAHQFIYDRFYR